MKCFIAIVILLFTHKCYAQLSIDYEFYDSNDKEIFYYEDFADSITDENWVHDDTAIYVKEGRYTFYNHYVNDYACRLIDLPIEDKNDFEIEMRVLLPCKCPNEGVIIWGGSCGTDISNKWFIDNTPHSFTYIYDSGNNKSNNGYCRIDTKKYSFNIYTIRKVQDHYFLYVNGKYAFKTQFTPLLGTMFGFGASPQNHIIVDKISASYLKKTTPIPLPKFSSKAFQKLVNSGVTYPKRSIEKCEMGSFLTSVLIDSNGKIDNISTFGVYPDLEKEAERILKLTTGYWQPGQINGLPSYGRALKTISFTLPRGVGCYTNYQELSKRHFDEAMILYKDGRLEEAIEEFKTAGGLDYTNVDAFYNIAAISLTIKDYNNACKYLQLLNDICSSKEEELQPLKAKIDKTNIESLMEISCY